MHRPSPATVISLAVLLFAMSGTAVAATGGDFLLGKANTATSVSSLTNTKGTALKLSAASTAPPLTVSNSIQVPNLNASELDGQPASAYLGVTGTAANSAELGGTPASGFIQGGGTISDGRLNAPLATSGQLVSAPGSSIQADCNVEGDDVLTLESTGNGEVATWFNGGGAGQTILQNGGSQNLDGSTPVTTMIWVQVDMGSSISTYTLTESANTDEQNCYFTGQVVTSNG